MIGFHVRGREAGLLTRFSPPAPSSRAMASRAFRNGADFAAVGMFDFQVAEDVAVANEVVGETLNRDRPWFA